MTLNFLHKHCFDSLLDSAGQVSVSDISEADFVIVLSHITSQNGRCVGVLFDDDLATATRFSGPALLFPPGQLFDISPGRLVPANKELALAPKSLPAPAAG